MTYKVVINNGAKKDLKKIKGTHLEKNFLEVIAQLKVDPYCNNQGFEKLVPPIKGFYSRRINVQHRVVYKVDNTTHQVFVYSAWGHYK